MKKKSLILGLVLSLGFAAAASAVVSIRAVPNFQTAATVDADDGHSWGIIGGFSGNSWVSDFVTSGAYNSETGKKILTCSISEGTAFKIRADAAWTVALGSDVLMVDRTGGNTYFEDDGTDDKNAKVKTGYNGVFTFTLSGNLYNYNDKTYGVTVSYTASSSYTVTEKAVIDSAPAADLATETALSTATFTPTDIFKTGFSLDGWYTDAACTSAYVSTTLSADTTLYAKYTSLTDKKYVYFSAPSGWAACYAYTFGGKKGLGAFPGTQMTMATDGVTYQGSGIYKVLFYGDSNDTQILFNKGTAGTIGTDQTADLTLTANTFYKLADASTGDADRGLAAAVVYDINAARRAVVASDPILVGSVCGISKATATSLVSEYDGLNSTAKGYVDAATDYVYNYADTTKKVDVAISDIVAQLRKIASAGSGAAVVKGTDPNQAPIIIMVVSLGIAAVATAGLWLSRRKEQR